MSLPASQPLPPAPTTATCARHPEQAAALVCPRCGTFACEACAGPGPSGELLCAACRQGRSTLPLPWDARAQLGVPRAFWRTAVQLLSAPTATLEHTARDADIDSSLLFAFLAQLVGLVPLAVLQMAVMLVGALAGDGLPGGVGVAVYVLVMVLGMGIWVLAAAGVGPFIGAALDHLGLKLVGARPQSFRVTFRGWALAQAPMLVGLFPGCGMMVASLWTWAHRVRAYRAFYGLSTGRAFAATVVAWAVLALPFVAVMVLAVAVALAVGK